MSHITKIDLEINDLDALKAALARVSPDLEFRAGQTSFKWYGEFVGDAPVPEGMSPADYGKCDHAVGIRAGAPHPLGAKMNGFINDPNFGPYELGIVKIPGRNSYHLVYDEWNMVPGFHESGNGGNGLERLIGKGASALRQAYAREVSIKTMRRQGYRVREELAADGTIKLHCSKAGQ